MGSALVSKNKRTEFFKFYLVYLFIKKGRIAHYVFIPSPQPDFPAPVKTSATACYYEPMNYSIFDENDIDFLDLTRALAQI